MFRTTSNKVQNQQLKVQEVVVRFADTHLYSTSGSDSYVNIGEAMSAAVAIVHLDDSGPACTLLAASTLSLVDSTAHTAGGDLSSIKVTGVQMAANDCFVVRFITVN